MLKSKKSSAKILLSNSIQTEALAQILEFNLRFGI